jgi:multidrug resistance efflux pump
MSDSAAPIKTPLSRLLMLWRRRFLPFAVWLVAVGAVYLLVQRQQVFVDAVGIVEAHTTFVAPLFDGIVKNLEVDLLDEVAAGDVVAVMDDVLIRAELNVAEMELARAEALLEAEIARFNQEQQVQQVAVQSDSRSFLLNEEQARLDHLDRLTNHETDKVELERLSVELARQKLMLEKSLIDKASYDVARLAHESLRVKVEKDAAAIALAEKNINAAAARREHVDASEVAPPPVDAVLHSLQADIVAAEAIVAEVKGRQEALTLRAPVSGQITLITRRPGENVLAGDPIFTIVGAGPNRVMAYVHEQAALSFAVGDAVELHSRTHPSTVARGKILKIGTQIEPLPLRLQFSKVLLQHGFQILVGELPENTYRPGETLDLQVRAAS